MTLNGDYLVNVDSDVNHFSEIYPNLQPDINNVKYYSFDSLSGLLSGNRSDLKLMHLNVQSLSAKYDNLLAEFHQMGFSFDIFCFTESWLTENNKNLVKFEGYTAHHSLREEGRRGGGISVYIRNCFSSKVVLSHTLNLNHIESLFVEIDCGRSKIVIGTIYRPPLAHHDIFIDDLLRLCSGFSDASVKQFVLCGDFNYDLMKVDDDAQVRNFVNTLNSVYLIPMITRPTRVTDTGATLIDNICVSGGSDVIAGCVASDVSDHFPVFILCNNVFSEGDREQGRNVSYRVINECTLRNMEIELLNSNLDHIYNAENVSDSVQHLHELVLSSFNSNCRLKTRTVSYKNFTKPWLNGLVVHIRKRQHQYLLYRTGKISRTRYNEYRNEVNRMIRRAKVEYFKLKFGDYRANIRSTWKEINNLIKSGHSSGKSNIRKLIVGEEEIIGDRDCASAFNDFFVRIGRDISDSVPPSQVNFNTYLQGNYPQSFFFSPVLPIDVINVISSLKNKLSSSETYSVSIIKHLSHWIAPILSFIINRSFATGDFPKSEKIARVVPIHKKGIMTCTSNYRPVSILPVFSKIFEKMVYNQLVSYLDRHNIISGEQYGFRKGRTTCNAFVNLTNYIYRELDNGMYVFSLFVDFKKAFDSVDHDILLCKLYHYGVRGVAYNFFKSYLSNRYQFVSLNDACSSLKLITHGVPQGSILGPLLFLVFIDDIVNSTEAFKFILYADDSTLSLSFDKSQLYTIHNKINYELGNLLNWLNANKLVINVDKTRYMVFSYRKDIKIRNVVIGSNQIKSIENIKFLGLHLDSHLTFVTHIN